MLSLQTNVDSLNALNNLTVDNLAQSNTIQQLSSGYRINKSGDDAAGLAIANGYRDNIAELTQGVNNANNGIAQLQIIDGGLSNISTILDRMKTLATESASGTFTGNRATLNQEYQTLLSEITRQASNIGLNAGGTFNTKMSVYIGGATSLANAGVTIDLSGLQNAVDATSLGLASTNILGNAIGFTGNTKNLSGGVTLAANETFTVNAIVNGTAQQSTITVNAGTYSADGLLSTLNSQLQPLGLTASLNSAGELQFSGGSAFNIKDTTATPGLLSAGATATLENTGNYIAEGQTTYTPTNEVITVTVNGQTYNATLTTSESGAAGAVSDLNRQLAGSGVYALQGQTGAIEFQSASAFSISTNAAGGVFAATGSQSVSSPTTANNSTANAEAAISAINNAIQNLGLVQGRVGAGENLLQYAVNLANSQITNFSTAESDIRDANVAADASKLTQSQVLEQTAVAAMAQANSESQVVLKLLQ